MNPELLLLWLSSNSSIKRVRAARRFLKKPKSAKKYIADIRRAFQKEDVPWVKNALLEILENQNEVKDFQVIDNFAKNGQENSGSFSGDVEAIQSDAIGDSIGQVLHEIEPAIGALKLAAREEISDYKTSKLKIEFDRLDELLETIENWRRVELAPRYREVNIYNLIDKQIAQDKEDGVCVDMNVDRELRYITDPVLLRIIISNALRNSIESTLSIDLDNRKPVVVKSGIGADGLWVFIVDGSLGLAADKKMMLKSRHSTKPGHRGMGLAIVDKAVNALNGTWELNDGKVRGAELFFEIPEVHKG